MRADHLAREAARLQNDETLNNALDDIREDALDALATANVDDKTMILRLQQTVSVVDEIRANLARYIVAADVQDDPGSFA